MPFKSRWSQRDAAPKNAFRRNADADQKGAATGLDVPHPSRIPAPIEMSASLELADVRAQLRPVPQCGVPREEIGAHEADERGRNSLDGGRVSRVESFLSMRLHKLASFLLAALLAACGTAPKIDAPPPVAGGSAKYYKDDGPGDNPPANLDALPDATPRLELLHRFANRPYVVLGRAYTPATALRSYRERGVASWYGRKFHGQKTSIGEIYDMYGMTAAHPTLALPSYARVTNATTGQSVVVRVNDRGPFLHGRIIDLSYAAAHRVGIAAKGSGEVLVEAIVPGSAGTLTAATPLPPVAAIASAGESDVTPAPLRPSASLPHSPAAAPISPDVAGGFAVQLGAFANFGNAQNFVAHVQSQLVVAQVEAKMREANGRYFVFVGPYPERDEARRVADRITRAFGFATTIAAH